ncbi:Kae1-associated serine/threonine protein kinase [Candidatus Woesearchaeota archaeon]|nr:Kae1-associated serine/threonine protein kinase [Candidatus Woesearchaeota archaeon]
MNQIARGAEAILYKEGELLVKERIRKSYRIKEIDSRLRNARTRKEAKLLGKADKIIPVPKVYRFDNEKIYMNLIEGKLLKNEIDNLDSKKRNEVFSVIGRQIARLHDADIIHGDLTTSNMILNGEEIFFIDFGLGFVSNREEDKAVDLHLLRQAINSRHYLYPNLFSEIINGYKESENSSKVFNRLELVEKRGRYKRKKEQ